MGERSLRLWSALLGLGAFATLTALDVLTDPEAAPLVERLGDMLETGLIVASATGTALLSGSYQRAHRERRMLMQDLAIARAEGEGWRERAQGYVTGLGEEIEKQFEAWRLTGSEREVGLLMLKGFSHREIAGLRGTSEATVRHQARAVYQKSRMPNRSALCAYFLEDLLPGAAAEEARPAVAAPGGLEGATR